MDGLIERYNDAGQECELFPNDDADPQDILRRLVESLRVRKFDLSEISLHEIFVRKAGGDIEE